MQHVNYLLDTIKRNIPIEILERSFFTPQSLQVLVPSLDHTISRTIINDWVLRDISMVGGNLVNILMDRCKLSPVLGGIIITIPEAATGGREVNSILSVYQSGTRAGNNGNAVSNAVLGVAIVGSSRVQPVSRNTFFIEIDTVSPGNVIRASLEHDSNFGNVSPRAMIRLGELTVLATKAYIYNHMVIRIEQAAIINGVSIGAFSNIIESYSDSFELYTEFLRGTWRKVNYLDDRASHANIIRLQLPRL